MTTRKRTNLPSVPPTPRVAPVRASEPEITSQPEITVEKVEPVNLRPEKVAKPKPKKVRIDAPQPSLDGIEKRRNVSRFS